MTQARQELGASGESAAADWYEQRGYTVVSRNWRCRDGEIDLVLSMGPHIVFCEVKTRSSSIFGMPAEAVNRSKQIRLRRLAATWLAAHDKYAGSVRFDVASVMGNKVDVIENAF